MTETDIPPPDCDRTNIDCIETLGRWLAERAGYTASWTESFTVAYQVCHAFEPREFVEQGYRTGGSTRPEDVARAFAEETFETPYQTPGFRGCLAAFRGEL
jgi:hypothetical protein